MQYSTKNMDNITIYCKENQMKVSFYRYSLFVMPLAQFPLFISDLFLFLIYSLFNNCFYRNNRELTFETNFLRLCAIATRINSVLTFSTPLILRPIMLYLQNFTILGPIYGYSTFIPAIVQSIILITIRLKTRYSVTQP